MDAKRKLHCPLFPVQNNMEICRLDAVNDTNQLDRETVTLHNSHTNKKAEAGQLAIRTGNHNPKCAQHAC
jgi:hypothetical protein